MNSEKYKPVIVVVAFNRLNSLKRLLLSLTKGQYPENTKLIISIDHSNDNKDVVDFANQFIWSAGEKEVISYSENIGLRRHIISCGDLSIRYGSVIILEDDLFVSPFFYDYSTQALDYYDNQEDISGIGLLNYKHIEKAHNPEPFSPAIDDSDVYFIQYACSSGQAWSRKQWESFRKWYDTSPDIATVEGMPERVLKWPDRSWKKYFIAYLVRFNRFFVYPRVSLTSNFGELGSNTGMQTYKIQSPLLMSKMMFSFRSLKDSSTVYDAYFEILPDKLKVFNSKFQSYNFAVDLYGYKNPSRIKEEYLLTTKNCREYIYGFTRSLKPHDMNVILDVEGTEIFFCRKCDIATPGKKERITKFVSDFNYFYRTTLEFNELMLFAWYRIYKKLIQLWKGVFI